MLINRKSLYITPREKEGTVKKLLTLLVSVVVLVSPMTAQRRKPVYDPETKEGLLIQHIQQEDDPAEKLHYMEQFIVQYPSNPNIGWVYDQILSAYMKEKAWDQAMRIGDKRIALDPEDLDAAKLSLTAAESKGNPEDIAKWVDQSWRIASRIASKGGRAAADAQQTQLFAEYTLFSTAQQTTDPATRLGLLKSLQERNPKSPYAENIPAECFAIYRKLNQMDKALALADRTLADDPDNIDMLMAVAEFYFASGEGREKVIANSVRVIDVLAKKPRPASLGEEDWAKKKSHMLASAYYMGGVCSSITAQYGRADQMLRAALPLIAGDGTQEATAFYQLGIANYHLADKDPSRAKEALAFWRRCASIKSNFQAQALKNVQSVRNEFNLP
jgi:tetratricopeptide (TPR) repeat protein